MIWRTVIPNFRASSNSPASVSLGRENSRQLLTKTHRNSIMNKSLCSCCQLAATGVGRCCAVPKTPRADLRADGVIKRGKSAMQYSLSNRSRVLYAAPAAERRICCKTWWGSGYSDVSNNRNLERVVIKIFGIRLLVRSDLLTGKRLATARSFQAGLKKCYICLGRGWRFGAARQTFSPQRHRGLGEEDIRGEDCGEYAGSAGNDWGGRFVSKDWDNLTDPQPWRCAILAI